MNKVIFANFNVNAFQNRKLSKNFLTDSDDVKPEEFPNLSDKAAYFTE